MRNGKDTGTKTGVNGEGNGRDGRQGAGEGTYKEGAEGDREQCGEGALGRQGWGGEDGGVKTL